MKVSYSWLKDFVDIKLKPQKLADELTMAGLSVDTLERIDGDWVYDIEVVSNRPDWLSMRGIAREVAAITKANFKDKKQCTKACAKAPASKIGHHKAEKISDAAVGIRIDDTKGCRLYYGNLIKGVKVAASPQWLARRLSALGLRPINNVVDITNYCLMEYGQPLHAFDFDKISQSEIIVRRAREGERLVVIDDSEKKLSSQVLVIADAQKPVAVAGIMGGKDTEVTEKTTDVLLESACFDPVVVRRGSRSLGITSDSSYRFERGVDIPAVKAALERATEMICDLCGGTLVLSKYSGSAKTPAAEKILVDFGQLQDSLGIKLSISQARSILEKLGFGVKSKGSAGRKGSGGHKGREVFQVCVPAYRRDVRIAEDVAEEIARIYGYNRIPLTAASIKLFTLKTSAVQKLVPEAKNLLVSMGLKEVITYSLVSRQDYEKSGLPVPDGILGLENPLSQDYGLLRTTILPSMLSCISFNINHGMTEFEIFEIAHVFGAKKEEMSLGIALVGAKRATWQKEARSYTLFDLKGILETLLDELLIKDYAVEHLKDSLGSGLTYKLVAQGNTLACFGKASEAVKKNWGIKCKEDIFLAEVSVDSLAACAKLKKRYKSLASTPSIIRDISALARASTPYAKIKELIERQTQGLLKSVALVERYTGKEIPEGSVGLTISLEYNSEHRTLTDAEINPVHQRVLQGLVEELSLVLR